MINKIINNEILVQGKPIADLFNLSVPINAYKCGIYFLINSNDEIVYIGQSDNIISRIAFHIKDGKKNFDRTMYINIDKKNLTVTECALICYFKPVYNKCLPYNYNQKQLSDAIKKLTDKISFILKINN